VHEPQEGNGEPVGGQPWSKSASAGHAGRGAPPAR
jgi:hypothetical protein